MGNLVLVLLAIAWGVLLIPKLLERRSDRGSGGPDAIRAGLAMLHARRSAGHDPLGRRTGIGYGPSHVHRAAAVRPFDPQAIRSRRAAKRRRDVFLALLGAAIGSAMVSMVPGFAVVWKVNIAFDLMLLGYVGLLLAVKQQAPAQRTAMHRASSAAQFQRPVSRRQYEFDTDAADYGYPLAYARASNE